MDDHVSDTKPLSHYEYAAVHDHQPKTLLVANFNAAKEAARAEEVRKQAQEYMMQLEGWCSELKSNTLIDLVLKVKPSIIVEIGVWGGKSLIPMACALRANGKGTIFGIDPWDNSASIDDLSEEVNVQFWKWADHEGIMRGLVNKIEQFGLRKQIILIKSTSEDASIIPGIEILHIDGNHSKKASMHDVKKWVPLMKSGGWIVFDDMTWTENGMPTTAHAVEWLDQNCIRIAVFKDIYCVWGLWVKP